MSATREHAAQTNRPGVIVPTKTELRAATAAGRSVSSESLKAERRAKKKAGETRTAPTKPAAPFISTTVERVLEDNKVLKHELACSQADNLRLRKQLLKIAAR